MMCIFNVTVILHLIYTVSLNVIARMALNIIKT